jgi:hypothetical protein
MSTRLVVDTHNELQELPEPVFPPQPAALRVPAMILSWIFHPVFVPVYLVLFMTNVHPYLFAGFTGWDKSKVVIQAFVMFTFFPIVTVLLLKALRFIGSLYIRTQRDRIIPLIACMIWYFWIWYVWRNLPDYPKESVHLTLAIFIASALGLMANIYMKVSLHAISMGVMLAFIMILSLDSSLQFGIYISAALLITGLVCTARFIVSDHTQREVYGGLFLGILSQLVAFWLG